MATLSQGNGVGERRTGSSPRPKGRENAKDTLCRNVTIYGHCRYEDKGCAFNHDPSRNHIQQAQAESANKKRLNVDSPAFTPGNISLNGSAPQVKSSGLSPRAASAAPFRPKNFTPVSSSVASSTTSTSSLKPYNPNAPDFLAADVPEFLPQNYSSVPALDAMAPFVPPKLQTNFEDEPWGNDELCHPGKLSAAISHTHQVRNAHEISPTASSKPGAIGQTKQPSVPLVLEAPGPVANLPKPDILLRGSPIQDKETTPLEKRSEGRSSRLSGEAAPFVPQLSEIPIRPRSIVHRPLLVPRSQNYNRNQIQYQRQHLGVARMTHIPGRQRQRIPQRSPHLASFPLPSTYNARSYTHTRNQGENNANLPISVPFESQFNDTSAMTPPNPIESELSGNLYASDGNGFSSSIFPSQMNQNLAQQPLQYHLYANLGPAPTGLQPNQRLLRDSFLPEDLRQKLHRKSEALLRTFGSSHSFPPYHALTPLPENTKVNRYFAGYESSLFKAVDSRDGRTYCLRRIYPFKVDDPTLEERFKIVRSFWRRVKNGNVVSLHEVFTSAEAFGESSLIIVSDYHPESLTLQQAHSTKYGLGTSRRTNLPVPENLLWKYIVQISNALRAIHAQGISARLITADKLLVTDEDRIRFNGCAIGDLLNPSTDTLAELQRSDLSCLGNLIVSLAIPFTKTQAFNSFERIYSQQLRDAVDWLLHAGDERNISSFAMRIGPATMDCFTTVESDNDMLVGFLNRELENGRLVRLLMKLGTINERPEFAKDPLWSEYGPRGKIKLFRDYVFHQVDEQGRPVQDMGHMLACLNKLDVGLDEYMRLESRDGKNIILVSFKEMKQLIESAFQDLMRRSRA